MITIAQAAKEIIDRSPFLRDVIAEDVGNFSKIARKIQPQVEKRLYEEVSEAAITMALHRIAKSYKRPAYGTVFLKQLHDITIRSGLTAFVFATPVATSGIWSQIPKLADKRKETFFAFSRGLHESLLVVNQELVSSITTILSKQKGVRISGDLSALTMRLPDASLDIPGVYYPILKALAEEGISFIEITSVGTEFSIILENKDIDRAFSVVKRITS